MIGSVERIGAGDFAATRSAEARLFELKDDFRIEFREAVLKYGENSGIGILVGGGYEFVRIFIAGHHRAIAPRF